MNDMVKISIPSLAMSEEELIKVLQGSLYPGAQPESIKLVIGYCKAGSFDPMQKPVHIVPMSVKTGGKKQNGDDEYAMRDVIMPGVGLYRTLAARTGEYAGMTEPEFGPAKTLNFSASEWVADAKGKRSQKRYDATLEYPEWCKVTVRRIVSGHVVEFSAKEYWLENYATAGKTTSAPNAMWKKRPFGQIAKCAEAQALRKGFPEAGAEPTADEMAGKSLDDGVVIEHQQIEQKEEKKAELPAYTVDKFKENLPTWTKLIKSGKKTVEQIIATVSSKGVLSEKQKQTLEAIEVDPPATLLDDVKRICAEAIRIEDTETAFLKLDDARFLLNEMLDENKVEAVTEIDAATKAIKERK